MVREITFAKQLVTNQWRGLLFSKKAASLLIFYLFVLLPFILYKYFQFLSGAVQSLTERKENYDLSILFFINIAAWLLPIWSSQQISAQLKTTRFFPFNNKSLFFIKYLSFFLLPTSIFAVIFSGLSFYPIFCVSEFVPAVLYASCVISLSISINFTIINLLDLHIGRFLIFIGTLLLTIGLLLSHTYIGEAPVKIITTINNILATTLFGTPIPVNLLITSIILIVGAAISFLALKLFLEQESAIDRSTRKLKTNSIFGNFKFYTKYGLLIKKDLKYLFRLSFTPYLSLLILIYYAYFLNLSNENGYQSFSILLSFIFIPQVMMFYNFFGFDKVSAIERYALFPIDPSEIVKIKNLAAILVSMISLVILLPVVYFKFNVIITVIFSLKWCLLTAAYLTCGNFLSVIFSFNRRQAGSFPSNLFFGYSGAVLITSFILVLVDSLGAASTNKAIWVGCLILFIYMAAYIISLKWNKKYLNGYWETMRQSAAK